MLAKLGAIVAIPFVLLIGVVVTTDTVVVDVKDKEDGVHLVIPVPMPLVNFALNFAPQDETTIECAELWQYREPLRRVVAELRKAPDGEFVRVEERDTFVTIRKQGGNLLIHVEEGAETKVDVKFPLKAADRFLARLDGETFTAKDLMASIGNTTHGEVVHVVDGSAEVKITVW